jgi:hypothetical protein
MHSTILLFGSVTIQRVAASILAIEYLKGMVDRPRFIWKVRMQFMRYDAAKLNGDVISGILNCVCPECGGPMGGRGKEFKCQGECRTDWRPVWERDLSAGFDRRSRRAIRLS